ncbi:alpha-ketoglutarate-dependent dioxygenase AlkB family protein [Patiriisocius marinus]|uniref:Alkylated DNA repair protein n=1 Tax=Patiriisocius marinus TaxID=1397112 RepID=A0A5J4J6Z3_9FLAO|nr:alpha-ketoglutarate-dependent dioxygenase AlkB [Patiriisocius marinus]GER60277.1 alkylated DNA repair protein [Patiriisocius marinus]
MKLLTPPENIDCWQLPIPDAEIFYYPNFYEQVKANALFKKLYEETQWQEDDITIFGKTYKQPRLTALYGNNEKAYKYSNIIMFPKKFTETLLELKNDVEKVSPEKFTSVLLNLYRDGSDSNGWHSDNEKELGNLPFIASLSFGAKRSFQLKHITVASQRFKIELANGSLILMGGETQKNYKHQLPKTKRPLTQRINLTFRTIY